jgi:glycosyltransferase involved in cell wall biosynthesis
MIRVANFMHSSLKALDEKGLLETAPLLYNPENKYSVTHFSAYPVDLKYEPLFNKRNITIACYRSKSIFPFRVLAELRNLYRAFKTNRVDIIRGRQPYHCSLYGLIMARIFGCPFVVSLGGDNRIAQRLTGKNYYNNKLISYALERLVLRYSDKIICPNQFTKHYVAGIIGEQLAEKKCSIVPWINFPRSEQTVGSARDRLGIPKGKKIIPIIGFINEYKYSDVLFEAIEALNNGFRSMTDYAFVFCGEGPLRAEGIKRFKSASNVYFPGWVSQEVSQAVLKEAAFCLIPMSGFVLLEAAGLAKCVITSNVEWHAELVSDSETGLLVTPSFSQDWKSAIIRLILNPEECTFYGLELQKRYHLLFSPEKAAMKERELYLELISKAK